MLFRVLLHYSEQRTGMSHYSHIEVSLYHIISLGTSERLGISSVFFSKTIQTCMFISIPSCFRLKSQPATAVVS